MIDAHTRLFGVIGNPVRHSLSPVIHNGSLARMGMNAAYLAFEVQDLAAAVQGIRGLGICGISVTLPFKREIIPLLDRLDDTAARIGAVNTVANKEGLLVGYNTDWNGALAALEEETDLPGRNVLLLGAGGAARAIAFGLKERGCRAAIVNRTLPKAEDLARELGFVAFPAESLDRLAPDVLINATSAGMSPRDRETPFPQRLFREGMVVMDIVYKPLETVLLREAREKGCRTIDGLAMLAHQGAAQVEIWTGQKPDVGEIKEDLKGAISNRPADQETKTHR